MSAPEDDFAADLAGLLADDNPPVKKAAAKTPAKKTAARPEVSEVSPTPEAQASSESEATQALLEQLQQTIADQQQQIEALKSQDRPPTTVNVYNPNPEHGIPEAVLASRQGKQIDAAAVTASSLPSTQSEGTVQVHFLEDGFTMGARVFYRGEVAWLEESLATLTASQQRLLYGRPVFAQGPWPGEDFDLNDPALNEDERAKLARIVQEQQQSQIAHQRRLFEAQRR